MDPDLDPQKIILLKKIFCLILFEGTFTSFFKDKKSKVSHNSRYQGFSYYFYMMIEGYGSRAESGSGSIPLTNGSESGRPKNMWIRIRILIRNTALDDIVNWIKLLALFPKVCCFLSLNKNIYKYLYCTASYKPFYIERDPHSRTEIGERDILLSAQE